MTQSFVRGSSNAEIAAGVAGQTVASAFVQTVARHGASVALRDKPDPHAESWRSITWSDYADQVARAAAGLQALGVERGDRIVLMLRNVPEFHVLDLAAVFCGATPISIYNSSSADQIEYLAGHCKAVIAISGEDAFTKRIAAARPKLDRLRALGAVHGGGDFTYDDLVAHAPIDLSQAAAEVDPESLATVIYTSGTTGPPKGVMLTHHNIAFTVESLRQCYDHDMTGFRVISYLPMAHIAERMTGHYQALWFGLETSTCPDTALLAPYCREIRPQVMFGVPRVWEKFHAGVMARLGADADKLRQFGEGVDAAIPIVEARTWGRATKEQEDLYGFLDQVAFAQVREALGFDQLVTAATGAAPIPRELLLWFRAIGIPLAEIYGMSESSGPMTYDPWLAKPGTVGRPIPGCEVKLAADGEVCCRGGNVFRGYLDDPEKTADALDGDGWLHSGDIGEFDDEGYLRIIDRKKELIITAGGKNVSPANLEAALKTVPLIGQAAAIGDQKPYIAALLVIDGEQAQAFASRESISYGSLEDLARHARVLEAIGEGVERAMAEFNNAERVKRWVLLHEEWLPDSEELTPTSKLKRRGIHAKYRLEIESLYE